MCPFRLSTETHGAHSTLACFLNGIHDSGVVCSMLAGYNPSAAKKWTREDLLTLREAITGSNKGVEVHSREAIFGTSLPLAVHLFSLAHRNRAREEGARGLQSLRSHPFSFSLLAISHCNTALFTFYRGGQKMVRQREKFGLTRYC